MAIFGINTNLLGASQGLGGLIMMYQGTAMAAQGARSAGAGAMAAAQYNASVNAFNLNRQLDELSRRITYTLSSQRAAAGGSGLAVTSKSFLAISNATLTQFEREAMQRRNSAKIEQQGILFEGAQRQAAYERQAEAIEFQGRQKIQQALPSLASQLFGGF